MKTSTIIVVALSTIKISTCDNHDCSMYIFDLPAFLGEFIEALPATLTKIEHSYDSVLAKKKMDDANENEYVLGGKPQGYFGAVSLCHARGHYHLPTISATEAAAMKDKYGKVVMWIDRIVLKNGKALFQSTNAEVPNSLYTIQKNLFSDQTKCPALSGGKIVLMNCKNEHQFGCSKRTSTTEQLAPLEVSINKLEKLLNHSKEFEDIRERMEKLSTEASTPYVCPKLTSRQLVQAYSPKNLSTVLNLTYPHEILSTTIDYIGNIAFTSVYLNALITDADLLLKLNKSANAADFRNHLLKALKLPDKRFTELHHGNFLCACKTGPNPVGIWDTPTQTITITWASSITTIAIILFIALMIILAKNNYYQRMIVRRGMTKHTTIIKNQQEADENPVQLTFIPATKMVTKSFI